MGPFEPNQRVASREIGRYVLFGEIAAGGMATVHYGRLSGPVGFSRTVAIKRLHPQFAKDPEFVTMFLDEARLAGRIRHPNVVPTLDVVATEGEIFLVMEYVQGESLSRLIRTVRAMNGRVPPKILATIMSGVLHGLHSAHEAKDEQGRPLSIVHRDVSPQNVLVGTDGVARVLDFGVAKAAGRLQSTREGQIKGKISYMAPEQLNGGQVTRQTDIYAASVVLWEAVAGQRLYEGDNEAMVVVRALEGRVEPPSNFVQGLPADLDAVIMKGLAKNVADRYATARDMALALEKAVGIAAPSEVGEWVEEIAGTELTKRAATIAEIESSSIVNANLGALVDEFNRQSQAEVANAAALAAAASNSSPRNLDGVSQVSTISVSRNGFPEMQRRQRRGPIVALVTSIVLLMCAIIGLVAMMRRGPDNKVIANGPETVPSANAVDAGLAIAEPTAAPDAAVVANGADNDSAGDAGLAQGSPHPPGTGTPSHRPVVHSGGNAGNGGAGHGAGTSPPPPPPTTPKKNCDPPYNLDANGHKIWKMECL